MFSTRQVKKLSRSLLEVAGQTNSVEELVSRIESLKALYRKDKTFRHLMITRRVTPENKMIALRKAFQDNLGALDYEMLAHLLEDQNGGEFPAVAEAVLRQAASESSVLRMTVTSAAEMPQKQLDDMGAVLEIKTKRTVRVTGKADPAVLGGVKLRLGNTLVDGTVSRRLELVRQGLI